MVPDKAGVEPAAVDDGFADAEPAAELGPPDEDAPAPAHGTQVSMGSHSSELDAEPEPDGPLEAEDPWALEFPDSCAAADLWSVPVGAGPAAAPPLQLTDGATSGG